MSEISDGREGPHIRAKSRRWKAQRRVAIELLFIKELVEFVGHKIEGPIDVATDNKGAYDLCHRFSSAQHSRHIDRKMFKMREMRGNDIVEVRHVPTDNNPADIFTKILSRQPFERHRKTILNLHGDTGVEFAQRTRMVEKKVGASSERDRTSEG